MVKFLFATVIALSFSVVAQKVDVKDLEAGDDTTTIEIRKGQKAEKEAKAVWEVQDGTADIEGESGALTKDAKLNWKKACDEWKKEFRQDNKENKIISMGCGNVSCAGETANKVCTSKATYKIKTKNE